MEFYNENELEPRSPVTKWTIFDSIDDLSSTFKAPNILKHDGVVIKGENDQDWVKTLITEKKNPAIVVLDGHGEGNIVKYLKTINWWNILDSTEPVKQIRSMINDNISDTTNDGSTFASVKCVNNGFHCTWLGDSEIVIYHNETLYWRSSKHNTTNKNELANMFRLGVKIDHTYDLDVVDDKTITMVNSGYCVWNYDIRSDFKDCTNITRVFGHSGKASVLKEEVQFIKFNKPGIWRALVFTDGVGDMIYKKNIDDFGKHHMTARSIAEFAESKWNQSWLYLHPVNCGCDLCLQSTNKRALEQTSSKLNKDDIGVAILDVQVDA